MAKELDIPLDLQLSCFRRQLDALTKIVNNTERGKSAKDILTPMYEGEKHGGSIVEFFLRSHGLTALATIPGQAWLKSQLGIS